MEEVFNTEEESNAFNRQQNSEVFSTAKGHQIVNTERLEPKITEKRIWNLNHLFLGLFIAIAFVAIALFLIINYELDLTNSLIVILAIVIVYSGILFFLIEPKILRQVDNTVIQRVERPVIIEKPVVKEIPVEKKIFVDRPVEVIKEVQVPVEREVIKEVQVPVEKTVFVDRPVEKVVQIPSEPTVVVATEEPKKKLDIPKYDFVASEETRTYHTRNCRLGKLIKRKYKLVSNNEKDFIKEKFKPCKVCIKKKKRS